MATGKLHEPISKPESCEGCPLAVRTTEIFRDYLVRDSELMVVFDQPQAQLAHVWDTPGRRELWNTYIKMLGGLKISAMHALRCLAKGSPVEMREAFLHCRQYDRIQDTVRAIVTMGDFSWKQMGGDPARHDWVGFAMPKKEF